ncbi:MAG: hypothetical protein BWY21_01268 [Parcubacteria group bacterium ADurb.Bin216]|nr:MAG: hypothetical protein BWY21_01268 [Parcubacteria group bacterium ADurb.Bin216]
MTDILKEEGDSFEAAWDDLNGTERVVEQEVVEINIEDDPEVELEKEEVKEEPVVSQEDSLEFFTANSEPNPELIKEQEELVSKVSTNKEATKNVDLAVKDKNYDEFASEYPSLVDPIKAIAFEVSRVDEVFNYITQLWETIDDLQKRVYALSPAVEKLKETEEQRVIRQALKAIKDAHPDFESIINGANLANWIESKPSYKKTIYKQVYEAGTAEDIIDMLNDFKKETGIITAKSPESKKPVKQYLNLAVDNGSQVMPKASNSEPASFEDAWKQLTSNSK